MRKHMNIRLTEKDWLKLRDFNKLISNKIRQRLPEDWQLTFDEIESAVYDTFIKLLNNYVEGAMSPTSYCFQFAEKYTYRDLIREYRRLKNQETLDALYSEDKDDDKPCRHKHGIGEVPALTVDERDSLDRKLETKQLLEKMTKLDRMIAELIMDGKSYRDVADEIGMSQVAVMKRMKKYKGVIA